MNFLAHFHLSGPHELLSIGNFVGDFIKGIKVNELHPEIQKGIELHRFIDEYTDAHPVVKEVNQMLYADYSKFAPVVSDVFFDYFLATNFAQFSEVKLKPYTQEVYARIDKHRDFLTPRAAGFYAYVLQKDIFYNYGNKWGMQHVFNGLSYRTRFKSNLSNAVETLTEKETELNEMFLAFYPDLVKATVNKRNQIVGK
jgi:acyl carrier protein phosphodiesterase